MGDRGGRGGLEIVQEDEVVVNRAGRGGGGRSWRKRRDWEIVEEEGVVGHHGGKGGGGRSWRKRRGVGDRGERG